MNADHRGDPNRPEAIRPAEDTASVLVVDPSTVTTPRHSLRRLRLEGQPATSAGEIPACRQARRHSCSPMASSE